MHKKKVLLIIIGLSLALFSLEMGTRFTGQIPILSSMNFVEERVELLRGAYPSTYDPLLGWIPQVGEHSENNYWGKSLTIAEWGIRDHSPQSANSQVKILAVGDSFTFGDEVGDDETWPAYLQTLSNQTVINGGVFGYGFDQTVLRAEQLAAVFQPDVILASLIADDISRMELSVNSGTPKPYFLLVDGRLQLKNVPPDEARTDVGEVGWVRQVMGRSAFLDAVMNVAGLQAFWYGGNRENVRVHEDGTAVGCLLVERLANFAAENGSKAVLVMQYLESEVRQEQPEAMGELAGCAREADVLVIDLYEALSQVDRERLGGFFVYHMTKEGNFFVAQEILEQLEAHNVLND